MEGTQTAQRPAGASPEAHARAALNGRHAPEPVNSTFTPDRPVSPESEPDRLARGAANMIRRLGRAAATTDASVWADLVRLRDLIDEVARGAAAQLHEGDPAAGLDPLPYSAFAVELGITPQGVYQRWFR